MDKLLDTVEKAKQRLITLAESETLITFSLTEKPIFGNYIVDTAYYSSETVSELLTTNGQHYKKLLHSSIDGNKKADEFASIVIQAFKELVDSEVIQLITPKNCNNEYVKRLVLIK